MRMTTSSRRLGRGSRELFALLPFSKTTISRRQVRFGKARPFILASQCPNAMAISRPHFSVYQELAMSAKYRLICAGDLRRGGFNPMTAGASAGSGETRMHQVGLRTGIKTPESGPTQLPSPIPAADTHTPPR